MCKTACHSSWLSQHFCLKCGALGSKTRKLDSVSSTQVVKAYLMVRRSKTKKRKEEKENERAYGKVALCLLSMQ